MSCGENYTAVDEKSCCINIIFLSICTLNKANAVMRKVFKLMLRNDFTSIKGACEQSFVSERFLHCSKSNFKHQRLLNWIK